MIGNLVSRTARRRGQFLRQFEQRSGAVLVGNPQSAVLRVNREGRARLDRQLIKRKMLGAECQRFFKLRPPGARSLVGSCIDEIERHAFEIRHRHRERAPGFGHIVQAAEKFQIRIVQRLHAERHTIHACDCVIAQTRRICAGGIGFQSDFHIAGNRPQPSQSRR